VCSNSHRQHRTTVNAEQAYRLDVRRGGHVGRDVLRTCLGVPLQAAEDLVWCADEVKPVAGALLLRRKLLLVGRNQEPCERGMTPKDLATCTRCWCNTLKQWATVAGWPPTCQRTEPRAQRDLFATPTDHGWRPRFLHRQRIVARVLHADLLAAEAGRALGRQAIDDLDSLLEHFSAFANQTWPRS
jgi:hypothetical protein